MPEGTTDIPGRQTVDETAVTALTATVASHTTSLATHTTNIAAIHTELIAFKALVAAAADFAAFQTAVASWTAT